MKAKTLLLLCLGKIIVHVAGERVEVKINEEGKKKVTISPNFGTLTRSDGTAVFTATGLARVMQKQLFLQQEGQIQDLMLKRKKGRYKG